jgi:serine/threonine-protein kinase
MVTLDQFIDHTVKSGLVDAHAFQRLVEEARASAHHDLDATAQTKQLTELAIGRGVLTPWQCERLLAGAFKGFFIGRYKLMAFVGSTSAATRYRVQDTLSKQQFEMLVVPRNEAAYFAILKPDSFIEDATG